MKILITGFEPFGESAINPSQMLVESLNERDFTKAGMIKAVLPVDQTQAPEKLTELITQYQPNALLAFGLALGRPKISLERVALNLKDFRIPDNQGVTVTDQPIHPDGPAAYFSTLPLRSMLNALVSAGIPAELSLSAGSYLCNLVFYTMMHTLALQGLNRPAGFVHLPALPEQAAESKKSIPSLSFNCLLEAAKILINEVIKYKKE
jgi:pyroglutamyl-peptidase